MARAGIVLLFVVNLFVAILLNNCHCFDQKEHLKDLNTIEDSTLLARYGVKDTGRHFSVYSSVSFFFCV